VRLDGSTLKGKIYVFVRNSSRLDKVDFYLDRSSRTTPPVRTVTSPPFDLVGTARNGTALPYDTSKLADGSHRIRVVLTWSDGTKSSRRGKFKVANKGTTPTPTAAPTATATSAPTTTAPAPTTAPPASTAPATTTAPTTTAPASPNYQAPDYQAPDGDQRTDNDYRAAADSDDQAHEFNDGSQWAGSEWIVAKLASGNDLR
jgi:hypothetical protein